MNLNKILLIIIVICTFIQCTNNNTSNADNHQTDDCRQIGSIQEINNYIERFHIYNDTCYLDSALLIANHCGEIQKSNDLMIKKIWILSTLHEFNQAIDFVNSLHISYLNEIVPDYQDILILRLKAMKAINDDNNSNQAQVYVKDILNILSKYCNSREAEITDYLESVSSDNSLQGYDFIALTQYYCYYSFLYGKDESLNKLNQLSKKYTSDNIVIEYIKAAVDSFDIMQFSVF